MRSVNVSPIHEVEAARVAKEYNMWLDCLIGYVRININPSGCSTAHVRKSIRTPHMQSAKMTQPEQGLARLMAHKTGIIYHS